MKISKSDWKAYVEALSKIETTAGKLIRRYLKDNGWSDRKAIMNYVYNVATVYGEADGALAAEMYDQMAAAEGAHVPAAEPAKTPEYGELAKLVNGAAKRANPDGVLESGTVSKVKRCSADTMLQNSLRDGAEFAWIPSGDTCAFCITLASRGWQRASKEAIKGNHAEHIHDNCDCTYAVRFDDSTEVEGYDPQVYRDMYYGAEGDTPQERINYMRRQHYAANKDYINAQKRIAYHENKEKRQLLLEAESPFKHPKTPLTIDTNDQSKHIIGGEKYNAYMETHKYSPSYLTITEDEAQKLVEKYHGTGILKLDRNEEILPSEMIVDNDRVIGYAVDNRTGKKVKTTGFKIHYSKKGAHIVPMYENQKEYWKERRSKNENDWLLRQKS